MVAARAAWWLDIETANTWSSTVALNSADIRGMVDFFTGRSVTVGIYSTGFQWNQITGGLTLGLPNWLAGASSTIALATTRRSISDVPSSRRGRVAFGVRDCGCYAWPA
jgi:hypothetical protein